MGARLGPGAAPGKRSRAQMVHPEGAKNTDPFGWFFSRPRAQLPYPRAGLPGEGQGEVREDRAVQGERVSALVDHPVPLRLVHRQRVE